MKLTRAVTTEQPLKEDKKELLKEVYERLEVFEQECRQYHLDAKAARDILRLRDPYQDPPNSKEKTLQLQTLKSTFNNCVADQMQNMPEPRLLPETPELQDVAEDLQDVVRYIVYDANDYESVHRRRAEDLYGPGTAITQIVWDPTMNWGKGDIALIRWPIEAFLWDTKAEDIQDARALIKVSWHPLSWYESHYPKESVYVNAEDSTHNDVGIPESQKGLAGIDEGRAMLLEYWYRRFDANTNKYTINVAYCAGGALLDAKENIFTHGMYPFVIDVHSTIEGSPVGEGMVQELAPMMRYINRYARYIDTNLRMSSKARMLVRKNSGIDREALADWSVDMVEGDAVQRGDSWDWLQHQAFPNAVAGQMLQLQTDLKSDSGANQFTRGETTGGIVSGKAIAALQESGGKITGLRTDTLNIGFRKIIEQVLWLMSEFYERERVLLITGRDEKRKEVKVSASKFFKKKSPPQYLVQVEVNHKNPVRIEAQNEMFLNAYTMAAQAQQFFPLSALFQLLNIDGKDRLMPIVRQNETYQQDMQDLQAQNQQMIEQMEQMQKENENLKLTTTQLTEALASGEEA